jgi:16S rRNA (guanine527-N7)-methyltransferase
MSENTRVNTYIAALREGADRLGLNLSDSVQQAMATHDALMARWARRINLTTITNPTDAAVLHGLDSLLFAQAFDLQETSQVVDVGSGAGFPGVVLAVARPALRMRLLEPIRKRATFLRVVLTELERSDVDVVEGRLEPKTAPWQVDAIVSRATIAPVPLVGLVGPHLRPGGRLVTTSGAGAPDPEDLAAAAVAAGLEHRHRWSHELPGGVSRVLDELVKPSSG